MLQLASLVVGALLAGQAGNAPASAVQRYGEAISACTAMADVDGRRCLADLLEPSHSDLERSYGAAMAIATAQGRAPELRQAQNEWANFTSAQCRFEQAQFRGGTAYLSVDHICQIRRNAARADELGRVANQ